MDDGRLAGRAKESGKEHLPWREMKKPGLEDGLEQRFEGGWSGRRGASTGRESAQSRSDWSQLLERGVSGKQGQTHEAGSLEDVDEVEPDHFGRRRWMSDL